MGAADLKHGMFGWADLMTKDPADSKAFYGDLFGWTGRDVPAGPGQVYTLCLRGEDMVAGLGEMPAEMKEQGVPPVWNSFIRVDDVDEVVGRVESLGGAIFMPPMDVLDSGRMAMISDPSGGGVAFWQPKGHAGADVLGEPNTMAWNELMTRDTAAAQKFFTELLGWSYQDMDMGEMGTYHIIMLGDRPVGGMMTIPDDMPADVPAHWDVYFAVEDVDAKAAQVVELGGSIMMPPTDISVGRFAYVSDRSGANFALFKDAGMPES